MDKLLDFLKKKYKKKYRILNHIIPLDFGNKECSGYTLAPELVDTNIWYQDFKNNLFILKKKEYLPICRLSDGEYNFMFGLQPPVFELNIMYIRLLLSFIKWKFFYPQFNAATMIGVSSGDYSRAEQKKAANNYKTLIKIISQRGYLAMHLTLSIRQFQQRYHPNLKKYWEENSIVVTMKNYVPFYFVYHMLSSKDRFELFESKRILLITGANVDKTDKVKERLTNEGALNVSTILISKNRSLYDKIDINSFIGNIDLVLIAAGIGKPNILLQCEPLSVPCIDIGFMFEVYANPSLGQNRQFCKLD